MLSFVKTALRGLFVLFALLLVIWAVAPMEGVDRDIKFKSKDLPDDLSTFQPWLDAQEFQFSNIDPMLSKRIVWADQVGQKTPIAVVYLHGFSASLEETRPVPDEVAKALGANLFYTRLAGHGRDGAALGAVTAGDWIEDLAEAMAIGRRLGDRVLVISTSTGGTLAAIGAADPALSEGLAGVVMISPNFGLRALAGRILDLPFARYWGPWVAGETRSFTPQNELHGRYWTTSYPTLALFPMAALVRLGRGLDYGAVKVPALVIYAPEDQVVDPARTLKVMAGWGGPVRLEARQMGPADDPYSHVIAGRVLSPGQTAATVALILDWAGSLPIPMVETP